MTVHHIEPEPGFVHFDFSREPEPAIRIEPGDTVSSVRMPSFATTRSLASPHR